MEGRENGDGERQSLDSERWSSKGGWGGEDGEERDQEGNGRVGK